MSEQTTIVGKLLDETARRDAIHFALAPVVAGERLKPGQHVGLSPERTAHPYSTGCLGIVDPFLKQPVKQGERFWLFLYPNTITNLRHQWEHPAFAEEAPVSIAMPTGDGEPLSSELMLKQLADKLEDEGDKRAIRLRAMTGDVIAKSQEWLMAYAHREINTYCETPEEAYERLLEDLKSDSITSYGTDRYENDLADEFWEHASVVMGKPIEPRNYTFSCSC